MPTQVETVSQEGSPPSLLEAEVEQVSTIGEAEAQDNIYTMSSSASGRSSRQDGRTSTRSIGTQSQVQPRVTTSTQYREGVLYQQDTTTSEDQSFVRVGSSTVRQEREVNPNLSSAFSSGVSRTPIEFDATSPLTRNDRRSSNSINRVADQARRQSNATFNSPTGLERERLTGFMPVHGFNLERGNIETEIEFVKETPMSQNKLPSRSQKDQASKSKPKQSKPKKGNDDDDEDGSSQGGTFDDPPQCNVCGGPHLTEDCPLNDNGSDGSNDGSGNQSQPPPSPSSSRPSTPNGNHPHHCGICGGNHPETLCPQRVRATTIQLDGRRVTVRNTARAITSFVPTRTWDKTQRAQLSSEDRIAFDREATGYVLDKRNKLQVQSRLNNDDEVLNHVHHLQHQLKALRQHMEACDIVDVCTVVIPSDPSLRTPQLERTRYNIFDDYPKLTPDVVAQSNAYYNMWIDEPYISENLNLTLTLLKKNSDERLYQKCMETYERYHTMQQGGSLMLILMLLKIHNASEQYMEHLKLKVKNIKISEYEGEDVNTVVSLLISAYKMFESASTKDYNRIPVDWCKDLLDIFQTSSVTEFNKTFATEQSNARREADKLGGQPVWPTHDELIKMASATYDRLKQAGSWDVPKARLAKSYNVTANTSGPPTRSQSNSSSNLDCFNCGQHGHGVGDCPEPLDQAKIDRARQAFFDRRRRSQGGRGAGRSGNRNAGRGGGGRGRGRPSKRALRAQRRERRQALHAAINALSPNTGSPTSSPPVAPPSEPIAAPIHAVQDVLRNLL